MAKDYKDDIILTDNKCTAKIRSKGKIDISLDMYKVGNKYVLDLNDNDHSFSFLLSTTSIKKSQSIFNKLVNLIHGGQGLEESINSVPYLRSYLTNY